MTRQRDLSDLRDLSRVGARAVITPGATLSGPFLASGFLERKLGDGYRDTFDQSDWCLIFLFCQACISLLRLPDPRAKRKTVLKVKCFKEAFNWFKMNLVSWCKNQEEVPGGDSPPAFGSVSVETIQETSQIFILTDIDGQISHMISNG